MRGLLLIFSILVVVFCKELPPLKVIRLLNLNETQYGTLYQLAESNHFDVWAANTIEGWMDIMIPVEADYLFDGYEYYVSIDDVESHLVESISSYSNATEPPVFYNSFPSYTDIFNHIDRLTKPTGVTVVTSTIGTTYGKNEIKVVRVRSGTDAKRAIVITCTIHAREWVSSPTCVYIIEQLMTTTNLLTNYDWHVLPVFNVDGFLYTKTGTAARMWRKNRQPTSASCFGVDLNRNYPYQWNTGGSSADPCSDTYHGGQRENTLEIQAIVKYLTNLYTTSGVAGFVDIHAYGAMWMSPWGYTTTLPPTSVYNDVMVPSMAASAAAIKTIRNSNYATGSIARVIYVASGGSTDTAYGNFRTPYAMAVEAAGNSFAPPASDIWPVVREITAGVYAMVNSIK